MQFWLASACARHVSAEDGRKVSLSLEPAIGGWNDPYRRVICLVAFLIDHSLGRVLTLVTVKFQTLSRCTLRIAALLFLLVIADHLAIEKTRGPSRKRIAQSTTVQTGF